MMAKTYNSFVNQTLHYFSRPHQSIAMEPIQSPAAWKAEDLKDNKNLIYHLKTEDIAEIAKAIQHCRANGKDQQSVSIKDFPLPGLKQKIAHWSQRISNGIGVKIIKGIPVNDWPLEDCELFFWAFGLYLGKPGAQDKDGHRLGHVRNITSSPEEAKHVRLYKTAAYLGYHCDAADAVGLLCINKAKEGGRSHLVSSVSIYNEILKRRPDLIPHLYDTFFLDTRDSADYNYITLPACRFYKGKLRTFYHADYFRSVYAHDNVPSITKEKEELMDLYDEISNDPAFHFTMDFEPGDIQLISNHTVIHGRTDYIDHEEPEKKRHLLRLWLSMEKEQSLEGKWLKLKSRIGLIRNLIAAKRAYKRSQ